MRLPQETVPRAESVAPPAARQPGQPAVLFVTRRSFIKYASPETAAAPPSAAQVPPTVPPANYGNVPRTHIRAQSSFQLPGSLPVASTSAPTPDREETRRGSKRNADEDSDEELASGSADKRARKSPSEASARDVDMMDVEEDGEATEAEDEVPELPQTQSRGRKRNRAAAASSFGADDEETAERRPGGGRKRRMRKSENGSVAGSARGKKRERDAEDEDMASVAGSERSRRSRRKRGKRRAEDLEAEETVDDEDADVSNDPLCGGKKFGEEWESHGVKYKVGPNGQRLRLELIKRIRTKYHMVSTHALMRLHCSDFSVAFRFHTSRQVEGCRLLH